MRLRPTSVLLAALVLLASCSSSHWYEHRFQPAPIEARISTDAVAGAQVRVLATVLGIGHDEDTKMDHAFVRVRLENTGSAPVALVAEDSSLLSSDLTSFGAPVTTPPGRVEVPPGANAQFDIAFPLPAGKSPYDLDLSGLNLHVTVAFGEKKITAPLSFQRIDSHYWDPGYPRVHVGVGMGWYGD